MFILDAEQIPSTAVELCSAIDLSLRKWVSFPAGADPVRSGGDLPSLTSLNINLSGGLIASADSLPFEQPAGALRPGPTVESFTITGHPILLAGTPLKLDLSAGRADFAYGEAGNRRLIATLQEAANGQLAISLAHADLEAGVLKLARRFAGDSVTIQKINITLTPISPTELGMLLNITAKKFVTAVIRVTGNLKIDDQMVATASNLKAASDGMVGNIAVGLLQPQLQKIDGKPLPLLAFSLGSVKLRGVEVHTANGVEITARFGSAS